MGYVAWQGGYSHAVSIYTNSLAIFYWFKRGPNRSTEGIRLINEIEALPEEHKAKVRHCTAQEPTEITTQFPAVSNAMIPHRATPFLFPSSRQATDAVVKAFLNIAACLLKKKEWKESQYACR
jgi:hypothetical protein